MKRRVWGVGFVSAIALAMGMGSRPVASVCLRVDPLMLASTPHAPEASGQQQGQRGATPAQPGGQRGGRGAAVAVMTMTSTGWTDGGTIALKYTQAGEEVSPPLSWSGAPNPTTSFVLVVHDIDALRGSEDTLHWLVWNIPGTASGLPEHVPQGPELPDGSRQISATGPYYRGPAAPAAGPAHHYLFELFALDSMIDVQPVGASPAETRATVIAAMAGHVRGKASLVGLYRRGS